MSLKLLIDQVSQNMSIIYQYIGSVTESIFPVTPENTNIRALSENIFPETLNLSSVAPP